MGGAPRDFEGKLILLARPASVKSESDCSRAYGELSVRRRSHHSRNVFSIGSLNEAHGELTVRRTPNCRPRYGFGILIVLLIIKQPEMKKSAAGQWKSRPNRLAG